MHTFDEVIVPLALVDRAIGEDVLAPPPPVVPPKVALVAPSVLVCCLATPARVAFGRLRAHALHGIGLRGHNLRSVPGLHPGRL